MLSPVLCQLPNLHKNPEDHFYSNLQHEKGQILRILSGKWTQVWQEGNNVISRLIFF